IVLPAVSDRDLFSEARMDFALKFDSIPAVEFVIAGNITDAAAKKLKQASEERRAKDEAFVKYAKQLAKRLELADRKSITFTEEQLRQQRKDIGAMDDDEDDTKPKKKEPEKFGAEPYTREVLNIT